MDKNSIKNIYFSYFSAELMTGKLNKLVMVNKRRSWKRRKEAENEKKKKEKQRPHPKTVSLSLSYR